MVHLGQSLAFGFEPGHDLSRVHAELDDLEGHLAADRLLLRRHVHDAHAPFAFPGTMKLSPPIVSAESDDEFPDGKAKFSDHSRARESGQSQPAM
jgi:hypothetical protein